jgi:hypothetical protein
LAAVFPQKAHRVRPTLATVAHHPHVAGAPILQGFQFLRGGAPLADEAEVGAVFRRRLG